ncbi:MAG TPA: type II CAAX endopeptidase family protein [Thermoanaerobaculia bacterium]|jgi:membrane protease YdiL (CAAX protease family)|nr:type II CAAX endopeptidase family protein [Thermoanaerobaculia bacterium]
MHHYIFPLLFIAVVYIAMIVMNERYRLFSSDHFSSPVMKVLAYLWLAVLMFGLVILITGSSLRVPTARELARVPFYSLFGLHAILFVFLVGWWLLTRRPPIGEFLNIPRRGNGEAVLTGFAVGVGGWLFTLAVALMIGLILTASGLIPKNPQPSPMVAWMAALPIWKKGVIVLSAMTIEEAFFRGWLQKRIGVIASTALFALAHSGLGQPLLLIGVSVISLVIGFTFYRTKNLLPGIIAHGIFDAVQLFVIIPVVFKMSGMGAS